MAEQDATDPLELARQLRLIVDRLRRTVRGRRSLDGVPRRHEAVLSLIDRKGAMSSADLARWEQITPQSMGAIVSELAAGGLIVKEADPADGRRELVDLTPDGRRVLRSIAEQRDADLAALFSERLTGEQLATVAEGLELIETVATAVEE
jgi:DNA-binding MarR family transcriptional regulator